MFFFGGCHQLVTNSTKNDLTKSSQHFRFGTCNQCHIKKLIVVSDETVLGDVFWQSFKNIGKMFPETGKKLATTVKNNPGRTLEIGAKMGGSAVSKKFEAVLSTILDVMKIYHTREGFFQRNCLDANEAKTLF